MIDLSNPNWQPFHNVDLLIDPNNIALRPSPIPAYEFPFCDRLNFALKVTASQISAGRWLWAGILFQKIISPVDDGGFILTNPQKVALNSPFFCLLQDYNLGGCYPLFQPERQFSSLEVKSWIL